MGTAERKAREKAITKDRILDAARDLFVREGYANVSIRRIADQLEISVGSIYLHFEDKAAIFEQLCQETFDRLACRMRALVGDGSPAIVRLRRMGRLYCEFGLDHPQHYLLTFVIGKMSVQEEEEHGRIMRVYQTAGCECLDQLRAVVSQAIADGALRVTDAEEATQVLWSGIHGLVANIITKPGFPWVERTRLVETMVDSLLDGMRVGRPT